MESTEEELEATYQQSSSAAENLLAAGSPVYVTSYPHAHVTSYPQVHLAGCPHFRAGSNEPSSCVVHRLRSVVIQQAEMELVSCAQLSKLDDPSTARVAAAAAAAAAAEAPGTSRAGSAVLTAAGCLGRLRPARGNCWAGSVLGRTLRVGSPA